MSISPTPGDGSAHWAEEIKEDPIPTPSSIFEAIIPSGSSASPPPLCEADVSLRPASPPIASFYQSGSDIIEPQAKRTRRASKTHTSALWTRREDEAMERIASDDLTLLEQYEQFKEKCKGSRRSQRGFEQHHKSRKLPHRTMRHSWTSEEHAYIVTKATEGTYTTKKLYDIFKRAFVGSTHDLGSFRDHCTYHKIPVDRGRYVWPEEQQTFILETLHMSLDDAHDEFRDRFKDARLTKTQFRMKRNAERKKLRKVARSVGSKRRRN